LENGSFALEVPSHDAMAAIGAMPHGRQSIDSLAASANLDNRLLHLQTEENEHHYYHSVKF